MKSYADGVYVGTSPAGPFTYMENSPVSYKPTGFMEGRDMVVSLRPV